MKEGSVHHGRERTPAVEAAVGGVRPGAPTPTSGPLVVAHAATSAMIEGAATETNRMLCRENLLEDRNIENLWLLIMITSDMHDPRILDQR
jgi:hypothetical protein